MGLKKKRKSENSDIQNVDLKTWVFKFFMNRSVQALVYTQKSKITE